MDNKEADQDKRVHEDPKLKNIHYELDDNQKPKKQNIQIVPVNMVGEIKLKDYIPCQQDNEEIFSDNSSDFGDDFSIAPSVIENNEHEDTLPRCQLDYRSSEEDDDIPEEGKDPEE